MQCYRCKYLIPDEFNGQEGECPKCGPKYTKAKKIEAKKGVKNVGKGGLMIAGLFIVVMISSMMINPNRSLVAEHSGEELCRQNLKNFISFNDPDSVRINSVFPNEKREGRYQMSISAKNDFGGYGKPIACSCGTNVSAGSVTDMHCDSPD